MSEAINWSSSLWTTRRCALASASETGSLAGAITNVAAIYVRPNFMSLIASKFWMPPPTRFVV